MGVANNEREAVVGTVCKVLKALAIGRWTADQLADHCGVTPRTIRRYIMDLSRYFGVSQEKHYYWLEDASLRTRARVQERFCSRGHDKYAPHGGYWVKKKEKAWLICAICRRASNNRWYETRGREQRGLHRRQSGESRADALPAPTISTTEPDAVR